MSMEYVKVLGLDVSTKTGWSHHYGCVNATMPEIGFCRLAGEIEFKKLAGMERVLAFSDWLHGRLEHYAPDLVVFEGYGGPVYTLRTLMEIGTALRMMCHIMKVKYVEVQPSSLKKFATGKGGAKKEEIMLAVYKRWGFEAQTNNEADAFVLAKIGTALLGDVKGLTEFQLETLEMMKKK